MLAVFSHHEYELNYDELRLSFPGRIIKKLHAHHAYDSFVDMRKIHGKNDGTKEGYVVRFDNGYRLKLKYSEYIKLHKLKFSLSDELIWEYLKSKNIEDIIKNVPDEMHQSIHVVKNYLISLYEYYKLQAETIFNKIKYNNNTRKDFALKAIKHDKIKHLLFALYDNKDINQMLWYTIKPENK